MAQPQTPSLATAALPAWRTIDLDQPGKTIITTGSEAVARLQLLSGMPSTASPACGLPTEIGCFIADDVQMTAIPAAKDAVVIVLAHDAERTSYRIGPDGSVTTEPTIRTEEKGGALPPADAAQAWTNEHEQALAWAISLVRSEKSCSMPDLSKAVAIEARPVAGDWELSVVMERSERRSSGYSFRVDADGAVHASGLWGSRTVCCHCHRQPVLPTAIQ